MGNQHVTGPGPFGLAISASGKTLVSANSGPDRFSLTVLEWDKSGALVSAADPGARRRNWRKGRRPRRKMTKLA